MGNYDFTFLAWPLGELPVAPLMRRPPVPVVEALAVLLVLAPRAAVAAEHQPLAESEAQNVDSSFLLKFQKETNTCFFRQFSKFIF